MNSDAVIKITGLGKSFSHEKVLRDIDLTIGRGSITGLVGANGAGKSTLIRLITGLYLPSRGSCLTLGVEAGRLGDTDLARIGYVHQEGRLIGWMYVDQLIRFTAGHYAGKWNLDMEQSFIKRFDIPLKVKVSTLSPGKRQQLAILLAICFEPELLVLDEPASGLDPLARYEFLQLLLSEFIRHPDRTTLISSHILSDIEQIIDHVLIFNQGEIVRNCAFDELQEEFVQVMVSTREDRLPVQTGSLNTVYREDYGRQALLVIRREHYDPEHLADVLRCEIKELPLSFEGIYRLVVAPHAFQHRPLELAS